MATHFLLGYQVVSKSFENFNLNCVNALFNSFKERLALFDFENMPSIFSELFFNQQKLFLCTTNLPTMLSLDKSLLHLGGQTYRTYWAGPFHCNWHNSFFMTEGIIEMAEDMKYREICKIQKYRGIFDTLLWQIITAL